MKIRKTSLAAATAVSLSLLLSGCQGTSTSETNSSSATTNNSTDAGTSVQATEKTSESSEDNEVEKPEKITIMVDGTFQATKADGQEEWVQRWEELTGIDLEIIQPDHDAYYDVVGQTFASGPENWPDVIILGSSYYSGYAAEGALWDMTEAWENSSMMKDPDVRKDVVESNLLDGKLYGLSLASGGGCVTYIRQQWLDNCGLSVPTNYEEYCAVLDAFSHGDPDGDGIDGNTVGVSAAGFIGNEAPYTNYLPEFYQDAFPSFYQDENGVWKDGFTEDAMKEAIQRM